MTGDFNLFDRPVEMILIRVPDKSTFALLSLARKKWFVQPFATLGDK
jgi:hypothetical protein